jgi:hypothetical protein
MPSNFKTLISIRRDRLKSKVGLLIARAAILIGVLVTGGIAQAIFIFDINSCSKVCGAPLGELTLPTLIGTTATAVELELPPWDEADIQSISWEIDPISQLLVALTLDLQTDPGCSAGSDCTNDVFVIKPAKPIKGGFPVSQFSLICTSADESECVGIAPKKGDAYNFTSASAPEPGSMILLGSGLSALGIYMRRRRNKA